MKQVSLLSGALSIPERGFQVDVSDAFAWLANVPDESVDCVFTDPPYESLEKHRAVGTTTRLTNDWFGTIPNAAFELLFRECYRILRPDTHCYVMCDHETAFAVKHFGEQAGFKFWKPLVWDKQRIGMGYHYRAQYELVLFYEKGKRKLHDLGMSDVISCPRVAGGKFDDDWRAKRAAFGRKAYPTEKPEELIAPILLNSTEPGDIVADPFCGSGSTGTVAVRAARKFIGCDISEPAVSLSFSRLVEIVG